MSTEKYFWKHINCFVSTQKSNLSKSKAIVVKYYFDIKCNKASKVKKKKKKITYVYMYVDAVYYDSSDYPSGRVLNQRFSF